MSNIELTGTRQGRTLHLRLPTTFCGVRSWGRWNLAPGQTAASRKTCLRCRKALAAAPTTPINREAS